MGQTKTRWTEDEEDALKKGVERHGVGKWRAIQRDTEFKDRLEKRSNVDLKDKWRNIQSAIAVKEGRPNPKTKRAPKKKDEGEGEEHGEPKRQRRTPRGTSSNAYLSEALVEKSGTAGETSGTAKGEGDCQVEQVKALVMDTIESNGEDPIKIGEIYSVVQKHDGGILKSQMDKKTLQHYLQLLVHEGVVEHVKRKGYILKKEDDQIVMGMGDDGDQVQPDQLLEVGNGGCCDVTAAADAKLKAELARKNAAEAEALYQMRKKEATAAVNAAEEAKARAATLKAIEAAALAAVDQVRPPPKKQR